MCRPFRAKIIVMYYPGRCPGLVCAALSGQKMPPFLKCAPHKINEKHIDKILEITEKDDDRSFKDAVESSKYALIYFIIFAGLFVFSTIFLVSYDKELYKEVIKLFAVFLGGFGFKSYLDRNR